MPRGDEEETAICDAPLPFFVARLPARAFFECPTLNPSLCRDHGADREPSLEPVLLRQTKGAFLRDLAR
ncbi:hypothetical protein AS156_00090 [Bradyrhizobium macuxiense]|uniref:Uncharacterized protein n=1 Tax=Bradyrhizobium macuxiense TaxID=1755647 RepID=A0A109JWI2_9BRAD|nr:hypothetical protein AS156_00090 [Bradyrhizobium macuxiense]